MARRTKDEAEKTRDALLDAAEDIFYAQGVSRTSLEQIAAKAGVTRGAVYWHFKDKLALCEAMAQRVFLPYEDMLEKLAAQDSTAPLKELKKACLHSLAMMASDKRRRKVVGIMERRNACKNKMLATSEKLLSRAHRMKLLAKPWTPRKAALALQALINGLIAGALEQRQGFHFSTTCPACIEAFFDALQVSKRG